MLLENEQPICTPDVEQIARERIRIAHEIDAIDMPALETIAKLAADARKTAYTPYSHYQVGAAILTINGETESGQNIEIVSYSETGHAEEQAIKKGRFQRVGPAGRTCVPACYRRFP